MFQAEETVCAKALGLERKAKVQSRREWSENDPGDVVSPPTQSEGPVEPSRGSATPGGRLWDMQAACMAERGYVKAQ